jgi:hypothetical protein
MNPVVAWGRCVRLGAPVATHRDSVTLLLCTLDLMVHFGCVNRLIDYLFFCCDFRKEVCGHGRGSGHGGPLQRADRGGAAEAQALFKEI